MCNHRDVFVLHFVYVYFIIGFIVRVRVIVNASWPPGEWGLVLPTKLYISTSVYITNQPFAKVAVDFGRSRCSFIIFYHVWTGGGVVKTLKC